MPTDKSGSILKEKPEMNQAIEIQAQKVRLAYAITLSPNPDYEREFDILPDMRADAQA